MATRRWKKVAALLKPETVYGTDSVPTGLANFIQLSDAAFTPLAGDEEARNLLQPKLGHQGVSLTGEYGQFDFSVEIAGSGVAGTAPAWGPLVRASGFAEVITAATDVQYDLIHDNFDSATIYYNADKVNHVLVGCRGTVSLSLAPKRIPKFRFSMKGLVGAITDQALPTVDQTKWKKPLVVNKANTTLSLHGWTAIAESLDINTGSQVNKLDYIGEELVDIGDRAATGTAVVKATALADVNWFNIARSEALGVLTAKHGDVAGNIVQFDSDAVQIGRPTEGNTNGIRNYSIPLMLTSLGTKEFKITVK